MHHAKYAINHFSNTIKGTSIIMHNPPKGLWMIIAKCTYMYIHLYTYIYSLSMSILLCRSNKLSPMKPRSVTCMLLVIYRASDLRKLTCMYVQIAVYTTYGLLCNSASVHMHSLFILYNIEFVYTFLYA